MRPSSVMWHPQQLRELQERGDSVRKEIKPKLSKRNCARSISRQGRGVDEVSHVEVAEVDCGMDEACGGVVAGALPREAQPAPRRQRPLYRLAPPAAHTPRPDGSKAERINPTAAAKPIEMDGKSSSYMDRSRKEGKRERTCARRSAGSRSMSHSAPPPSPWRSFSSISIFSRLLLWEKLRGEACGARVLVPRRAPSRHPRTRT
jgi:hypothetical protein